MAMHAGEEDAHLLMLVVLRSAPLLVRQQRLRRLRHACERQGSTGSKHWIELGGCMWRSLDAAWPAAYAAASMQRAKTS